jgi:hypothetical protein
MFKTLFIKFIYLSRNGNFSAGNVSRNVRPSVGFICTMQPSSRRVERIQANEKYYPKRRITMYNKGLIKFVVAFGLLAVLLIFLGVNYTPLISALSPAREDIANASKNADPVNNESQPVTAAQPVNAAAANNIESNLDALAQPASNGSSYRWPLRMGHDFGASPDVSPAYVGGAHSFRPPYQIGHDFGVP